MARLLRMPVVYVAVLAAGLAGWFFLDSGGKSDQEAAVRRPSDGGRVAESRLVAAS